ncbi:MAG: DUF2254 domain-containing protein [Egibacteraceae bacterium]
MSIRRLVDHLRSSFWAIPAIGVTLAVIVGLGAPAVERVLTDTGVRSVFPGGPDSARTLLSTIASSMITFTGLVFTITIVVLQLASAQYSPRLMRNFLRDPNGQVALAVFAGTFVYSLITLRSLDPAAGGDFVPGISLSLAFLLVLVSVGVFVHYISHIARIIQVTSIIEAAASMCRSAIDGMYPPDRAPGPDPTAGGPELPTLPSEPDQILGAPGPGVLTDFSAGELVSHARQAGCRLHLVCAVGGFVPTGAPIVIIEGPRGELDANAVLGGLTLSGQRTMHRDAAFGLRQLVDIAEKALSPGVNDPTTAVQSLDAVHDLLRRLGTRDLTWGCWEDEEGEPRLFVPVPSWSEYVALGLDEVRHYGAGSLQVVDRIDRMLVDLERAVPPERHAPLDRQRELLRARADQELPDVEHEVVRSGTPQ